MSLWAARNWRFIPNEICFHQYNAELAVGCKRGTLEPNRGSAEPGGAQCAGIGRVLAATVGQGDRADGPWYQA